MAKILSKSGISTGQDVLASHVTQSIDALTGIEAYDITISGSLDVDGKISASNIIYGSSYYVQNIQFANYHVPSETIRLGWTGDNTLLNGTTIKLGADVTASGAISASGDIFFAPSNADTGTSVLTIDPTTGKIFRTGSYSTGGGGGFTPSLSTDLPAQNITASSNISASGNIFFNPSNADTGTSVLTIDPTTGQIFRTGSYSTGGGGGGGSVGTLQQVTNLGKTTTNAITSSGLFINNGTNVDPDINGSGQLKISGNAYTGYIALNSSGMNIGHNSNSKNLTFQVDEKTKLSILTNGNISSSGGQFVTDFVGNTSTTRIEFGNNTPGNEATDIAMVTDSTGEIIMFPGKDVAQFMNTKIDLKNPTTISSSLNIIGPSTLTGSLIISSSTSESLSIQGSGSTIIDVQGSQGQLFSVTDDLLDIVFEASDISGDPLLTVSGSGLVDIPVGPLHVTGSGIKMALPSGSGFKSYGVPGYSKVIIPYNADTIIFQDENLYLEYNDAGTDQLEAKVTTDPSAGTVDFVYWNNEDDTYVTFEKNAADTEFDIDAAFTNWEKATLEIFSTEDSSYPTYHVTFNSADNVKGIMVVQKFV